MWNDSCPSKADLLPSVSLIVLFYFVICGIKAWINKKTQLLSYFKTAFSLHISWHSTGTQQWEKHNIYPVWHKLHLCCHRSFCMAYIIHLLIWAQPWVCMQDWSHCLLSQSPPWLVLQPSLTDCIDPTGWSWLCLSPQQTSQAPPCLHGSDHQIPTGIPLPTSMGIKSAKLLSRF